jgi:hypothetical protein
MSRSSGKNNWVYFLTQSFAEKDIFCSLCKKYKKMLSRENLFWGTKNCLYYIGHKKYHFLAKLCERT